MNRDPDPDIPLQKMLPSALFHAILARLKAGMSVSAVTRWLMGQDRGACQHLGHYDTRKQVAQLKACIDRNELLEDPPAQPQGPGQSPVYGARLKKLEYLAAAGRATGYDLLRFCASAAVERLRELRQRRASAEEVSAAWEWGLHVGERLCKVGADPTGWDDFDAIKIPELETNPEAQAMKERISKLTVRDRLLMRSVLEGIRNLAKLKLRMQEEEEAKNNAETPPPEPTS